MTHLLISIIYLAFISLGLPDAVFGGSWPTMYLEFGVPVSYAGIVTTIISLGTIVSSLQSDRLTYRLGTGKVTAISVAMTAIALLGFVLSGGGTWNSGYTTIAVMQMVLTAILIMSLPLWKKRETVINEDGEEVTAKAIIGVQMASAYMGTLLMPPVFGIIANHISVALLPVYLLVILVLMFVMYERLVKKSVKK